MDVTDDDTDINCDNTEDDDDEEEKEEEEEGAEAEVAEAEEEEEEGHREAVDGGSIPQQTLTGLCTTHSRGKRGRTNSGDVDRSGGRASEAVCRNPTINTKTNDMSSSRSSSTTRGILNITRATAGTSRAPRTTGSSSGRVATKTQAKDGPPHPGMKNSVTPKEEATSMNATSPQRGCKCLVFAQHK